MNQQAMRGAIAALAFVVLVSVPASRADYSGRVEKTGSHRVSRPPEPVPTVSAKLNAESAKFDLNLNDMLLKSSGAANKALEATATAENENKSASPAPAKLAVPAAAGIAKTDAVNVARALVDYAAIEAAYSQLAGSQTPPLASSAIATPGADDRQRADIERAYANAFATRQLVSVHRGSTTGINAFTPTVDVDNCGCGVPIPTPACMQQRTIGIGQQMTQPALGVHQPMYGYGATSTGYSMGTSTGGWR